MFYRKKTEKDSVYSSRMSFVAAKVKKVINIPTNSEVKQLAREIMAGSMLIYIILEMLSNRSVISGLFAPFNNPLMFICNTAMIGVALSTGLLLPKRHIGYLLSAVVWLWLGSVNFILLGSRTTPLTAMDFKMLTSVFTVIGRYLNLFQLVLFAIAMVLLIIGIIILCMKFPRTKWLPAKGVISMAVCYGVMMLSFQTASFTGDVSRNFGNIAHAYLDYGFAYSFTTSVVDRGIQKPASYSSKSVDELIHSMGTSNEALTKALGFYSHERIGLINNNTGTGALFFLEPAVTEVTEVTEKKPQVRKQTTPNIIFVQLETFFDVKRLKEYNFSQDPIPNFTKLSESYSSGYVTVPSIGAGTANTEFEILTGMSLDYFGAGEYPYKTILSKQTVESYAFDLSEKGYHTHAIHNNMGTFYARHSVYPKLGFDGFTSIEYMNDVTYNPTGWAKDENLIPEIFKVLNHTDTADFVFTVSVQAHGKYPDKPMIENPAIELFPTFWEDADDALPDEYELSAVDYQYLYYVNQLYEVDRFVGDLIKDLEAYPEPVIAVFYGDHLPTFEYDEDDLYDGTPFQTEYLIWDNMGLEEQDMDLMSYQLGSQVMSLLEYDNGIVNKFHQAKKDTPEYENELELLQYDLLYGEKAGYGGVNPFVKKKVSRGVDKAAITEVAYIGEALFIYGEYFTMWSEVFIDGVQVDTIFIDEQTLLVQIEEFDPDAIFKVSQMTVTGRKLSSTEEYVRPLITETELTEQGLAEEDVFIR